MKKITLTAAVAAALLLSAPLNTASATTIQNSFGLASPHTTLDFEGLGAGTPVENQFAGQGVVFTQTSGGPLVTLASDSFAGMDGFALNQGNGSFEIQFLGTVTEAAFAFMTNPGTSTFRSLLNGVEVEAFTVGTGYAFDPSPGTWFGFSGLTFDTIEVLAGGTGQAFRMDNLQFGEVTAPAQLSLPAALPIFVGGLTFFSVLRSRRKSA
jgi:hypothetical protein